MTNNVNTDQVVSRVRSLPGDFRGADDSDIADAVDNAQLMYISTTPWLKAGKLEIGLALGAAHLLTLDNMVGDTPDGTTLSGEVTSISEGSQSISSSGVGVEDSDLGQTVYGRMLLRQKQSIPTTPVPL